MSATKFQRPVVPSPSTDGTNTACEPLYSNSLRTQSLCDPADGAPPSGNRADQPATATERSTLLELKELSISQWQFLAQAMADEALRRVGVEIETSDVEGARHWLRVSASCTDVSTRVRQLVVLELRRNAEPQFDASDYERPRATPTERSSTPEKSTAAAPSLSAAPVSGQPDSPTEPEARKPEGPATTTAAAADISSRRFCPECFSVCDLVSCDCPDSCADVRRNKQNGGGR